MAKFSISLLATVIFLLVVLSAPAVARNVGPYFNFSVGNSEYDTDITNFDDSNTSVSLGVGFSLNRNLAIETNFINFGDSDDDIFPVWTISTVALEVCAVGKVPFSPIFSGYAKAGFFSWDSEVSEQGFGVFVTDEGTDITYGLGAMLNMSENVAAYFEYQNYDFDLEGVDISLDNYSIGFQLSF